MAICFASLGNAFCDNIMYHNHLVTLCYPFSSCSVQLCAWQAFIFTFLQTFFKRCFMDEEKPWQSAGGDNLLLSKEIRTKKKEVLSIYKYDLFTDSFIVFFCSQAITVWFVFCNIKKLILYQTNAFALHLYSQTHFKCRHAQNHTQASPDFLKQPSSNSLCI